MVLRRPPRPPLPPSAHDVLREARLLTALEGTAARTPRVLATCDDEYVLGGVPFYVMEEAHGSVITTDVPEALDVPEHRRALGLELVDALAEIHAVDWQAAGLEGFGKPTGYLERQLRRFNGLWEHNKTRELPAVSEVGQWLADNLPESGPSTIVHGDYRLGNVMVGDQPPARVVAVFDWELATIGDPLADVGYMTITWAQARRPRGPGLRRPVGRDPARGLSHPRRAGGPLRAAQRALGGVAGVVPGAGHLEGRGVHGGQLQGLRRGPQRRRVPGPVRRGRAGAGRAGQADRRRPAPGEGPARRLRRRPDHQRVRLLPRCSASPRAWTPTRS